jgi:hypothetical protein
VLSGAYSSIFIASPILSMLKGREPRWVAIEQRLATRGDRGGALSATDAAQLSTQMSIAAGGQPHSGGPAKRTGPIRPGSGPGTGSRVAAGTGTALWIARHAGEAQPPTAPAPQGQGQAQALRDVTAGAARSSRSPVCAWGVPGRVA